MKIDLDGKTAIVTGSGQGIGRGIAHALAKNGASVVIADISDSIFEVAKEIEAQGLTASPVKCDVTSKESVELATKTALDKFGRIDMLVNNAGIYPFKPFVEMTEKDCDRMFDVSCAYGDELLWRRAPPLAEQPQPSQVHVCVHLAASAQVLIPPPHVVVLQKVFTFLFAFVGCLRSLQQLCILRAFNGRTRYLE
jgi:NAD(P)-dependent dehydrogenase (short-subunit alcohol dehydrogenase family)